MEETELSSEADVIATDTRHTAEKHSSKEGWYGAVLLGGVVLVGCVLLGGVAWWTYTRIYLEAREEKVSITELSANIPVTETTDTEVVPESATPPTPSVPSETPTVSTDAKQETVSVLNGGGPKGSAGTAATVLKQAGYTKVTTGNTTKDYTGITVYYAAGKNEAAAAIVKSLIKQYPKATSQEAPKTDAEASSAALVVIIGK